MTDALVDDVEGEPGALPLLSTALLELWQKQEDGKLTLAAYRESGGVHGAVARLAEGTYARIADERKPIARALMLRLVGEGEGEAPVRRRAPLAELDLERDRWVADVLATLADSRLVTVGEGSVEVAHEALLREWPRLRGWIEEDAEGRRLRGHITRAATEWDSAGRDQSELYRGARLAAALDWSTDHAFELNEREREFVTESREASEQQAKKARRTNRRLRALLAGVALLLAAAVAGGILAVIQRGEARDAETAQLAQRLGAQALAEKDLGLSLLLARQAVAIDDTAQIRGNLLTALLRAPKAIGIMHASGDAQLWGAVLSPDGGTLAVSDFYGKLLFFDARTYEQIGEPLDVGVWVDGLAFSPDGKTLAYGGGSFVRLIDARTREQLADTSVGGRAARMAFTNDGSKLVVLVERSIEVLDAATLKPVGSSIELKGFRPSYIQSYYRPPHFALTTDGRTLVTASDAGELAQWDLLSRRKTRSLEIAMGYHALALSPDGSAAAVGIEGGIQLVDMRTGEKRIGTAGFSGDPNWLLFSPDGKAVVSANSDGTVTVWDAESASPRETLRGHSNGVYQPVFSRNGKTLYTVSVDGTAIAWDLTGNRSLKRPFKFTHDRNFDETFDRHPGRFSPDGRLIAVGLKEQGIALWDASDLTQAGAPLRKTGGEVKALAFSADGGALAAVTSAGQLTVWDVATRSLRHELPFGGGFSAGIAFSPDGRKLAAASAGGVELWSAATGANLGRIAPSGWASDVAFSPDGAVVALAVGGVPRAELWHVAEHSIVATLESGPDAAGHAISVAISPDGRTLALGSYGNVVRLWDMRTRKLLRELDHGGGGAVTLEFSRDSRILAVSGFEPVATLWDVATGTQIGQSLTAGSRTAMIDLSSDGRRLLMTLANGQGAVWDIDPASWARRACALANRTLTREEWGKFLPNRPYEPACTT